MLELIASGGDDPKRRWRYQVPAEPVTLGRQADKSTWAVPWDKEISGLHATLSVQDGKLTVRRHANARNKIYFRGQPCEEFTLANGEKFVIGGTTFTFQQTAVGILEGELPTPYSELTCSRQELQEVKFVDADQRIEVLAALPALIRFSPSDHTLETQVLEVLRQGLPRSTAAAVVWLNPARSTGDPEIAVRALARRPEDQGDFQPSARLILEAIRRRRQSVLYSWEGSRGEATFTIRAGVDWAICAPLPDEPSPGLALYVTGGYPAEGLGRHRPDVQKSDLKFAGLVADIFGALRQVRDLQRRQSMLSGFLSLPVRAALMQRDTEEVLKPRQVEVAVLFCDLRGSCRIAEGGENELAGMCDRVSEALSIMTTHIIDKDGVIGDFQGDAAMGFWGWPLETDDFVEQACRAALAIRRDMLRASSRVGGPLEGFACGVGVATGQAIAGRLGTQDQFKVGVFGPVVNLASRLESLTKRFQVPILLDENTATRLSRVPTALWARCRRLARIQPYGMQHDFLISELLPPAVEPGTLSQPHQLDYEAALDSFLAGKWPDARLLLDRLPADGPSRFLTEYIDQHRPPAADWNGIVALESK